MGLAAQRLEVTPSAVSHGLRKLRTLFNDELFLRAGTAMEPPVRAQALFEPVRRIIDSVANDVLAETHFDAARASREFSLAMTDMAEVVFLPPSMRHPRTWAPHCTLRTRRLAARPPRNDCNELLQKSWVGCRRPEGESRESGFHGYLRI